MAVRARTPVAVSADGEAAVKYKWVKPEQVNVRARARRQTRRAGAARGAAPRVAPWRASGVRAPGADCGRLGRRIAVAQALINDKGYTFLDIRTSKEYRTGNGLHWCARARCVALLSRLQRGTEQRPLTRAAARPQGLDPAG